MTSISAYLVYRSRCCQNIFDEPLFASSSHSSNFDLCDAGFVCECGISYSLKELEHVGIKRHTIDDLKLLGVSDIIIPAFLRKSNSI